MRCQDTASKPGTVSAMGGTPGSTPTGVFDDTPSARILPAVISAGAIAVSAKNSWIWLPIMSFKAGGPPLYGTWTMSIPAMLLSILPARCGTAPVPVEANDSLPGLALAYAISSGMVLNGSAGLVTSTNGTWQSSAIGTKSATGSYDSFL